MSFGKRPPRAAPTAPEMGATASSPPAASGDPHGRRRVFGEEVWQWPSGALLRELGFSPDDESNLVPNAASINAKLEEGKRRIDERLAKAQANAQSALPQATLRPFFLIPDPVWNGEAGTFLMTSLDLYPYDDWNVVFLAADDRTALVMDIALHPNGNVPAFVSASEKFMTDARARMHRATEEAELTANYAAFHDAREDMQLRVKGLAMSFARTLIDAWEKQKHPDARSPFAADPVQPPAPPSNEDATGLQALVEDIREEAEGELKTAAFAAARSAFGALLRRGE